MPSVEVETTRAPSTIAYGSGVLIAEKIPPLDASDATAASIAV